MIDVNKFIKIKNDILNERYGLIFFALFLQEGSRNEWDVVVSAKWIDCNKYDAIKYISLKLKNNLSYSEILNISKIVTINTMDDGLLSVLKKYAGVEPYCEVYNHVFFGNLVERAYIFFTEDNKISSFELGDLNKGDILSTVEEEIVDANQDKDAIALLEKKTENTEKIVKEGAEYYRNLGNLTFSNDTQKSLKAYRRSTQLDPDNVDGWNRLGILLQRTGETSEAISAYQTVVRLGQEHKNQEEMAKGYGNLGNVCQTRGDLDKAIEYHDKALEINESLGRKEGIAANYGNLGIVYDKRGDLDKAIQFYSKALEIHESLGRMEGVAIQYGNLGIVYKMRGEMDKAIEFYKKALQIDESLGRKEGIARHSGNLGNLYRIRGDWNRAIQFLNKALEINESLGYKEGMANDYTNLGVLYKIQKDDKKAREYWEKSLALYKHLGSPNAKEVQGRLDKLPQEK